MFRMLYSASFVLGTIFVSGLFLLPVALILRFLGLYKAADAYTYAIMRWWGRWSVLAAGGKVKISGLEKLPESHNICFYANHQEYSDIVLCLGWLGRPVGFIGKKELGMVPIMATWMKLSHSLFLDRSSLKEGFRVIARAARKIRHGHAIVIFPEGTRNKGKPLAEFKAGSFKISKMAGGWIVPLSIDGSWRFMSKPGAVTGGPIRLTIHDPIDVDKLSKEEWKDIPKRVQALVGSELRLLP